MYNFGVTARLVAGICLTVVCAIGSAAQSQPDSQAGAQLGEQSALAGKQAQGANTQKTTETSPSGATSFVAGTTISAELTGSLDSKKAKQGDAVNVRTADTLKSNDGRTILPKGTKITGHVTQASAKGAGQPDSSLGLAFDKAILKNGEEIPLNAAVQAVGAPPASLASPGQVREAEPVGGASQDNGRGSLGGRTTSSGPYNGTTTAPRGSDKGVNAAPDATPNTTSASNSGDQWNSNTRGVVGLSHLSLNPAGGNSGQGSVITSTGKNVHLDGGTRLILVTQGAASK